MSVVRSLRQRVARRRGLPAGARLPKRAVEIWSMRQDLRQAFDIGRHRGAARLYWWYHLHAFPEMGLRFDAGDDDPAAVGQAYPVLPQHGAVPVSWLMYKLWGRDYGAGRSEDGQGKRAPHPLRRADEQRRLLAWYFIQALSDNNLSAFLLPSQAKALLKPEAGRRSPRILDMLWTVAPELAQRFHSSEDPAFVRWCASDEALEAWPILGHPLIGIAAPAARCPAAVKRALPFGVNLVGHMRGRFGLGEDARMAALALSHAGVPFVVHNVEPSSGIAAEEEIASTSSDDMPYAINLVCMTGMETTLAALKSRRQWQARHTIGLWHWELPEWPMLWRHAYDHIDELWTASRFTYEAFCRSASVPVRHLPICVSVPETEGVGRDSLGLPEGAFLFAHSFDGKSSFSRKNPLACVRAFRRAFPVEDRSVGLVIKALRADGPEWDMLIQETAEDSRIIFVTQSFSRGWMADFYRNIDCFLSLHRSEGFGRNITEAMLLRKPVIVSAHSGNMDFTTADTAALVPVRLRPLSSDEYPYWRDQTWGEPDIDVAVRLMRRIVDDAVWRTKIATAGTDFVKEAYNPQRVSEIWRQSLERTYTRLHDAGQ